MRFGIWIAASSLGLLLVACGGPTSTDSGADAASRAGPDGAEDAEPVRGDWLVVHTLSDPESLNPLTSSDAGASAVLNWIFPPLLTLENETLEQVPVIARELPEVAPDGLTYRFRLRDDVTFSDGRPLTAHDVVFTLKATKNPRVLAPHLRNYVNSVRDVVAEDDHTVRFDIREPYFLNDYVLGGISPLPRHYYDPQGLLDEISVAELDDFGSLSPAKKQRAEAFAKAFNEEFHRSPMGPGAFYLRDPAVDVITGERIVLRRRDDFWAPDDPQHGDAWVDRLVFQVINDQESALVALKGGKLDRLGLNPIQHRRPDTNSERFLAKVAKKEHISRGYSYIGWNLSKPLFQDKRLRHALSHLVDKRGLIDSVLRGLGEPIESPIFRHRPEYNESLDPWPFDPARAKQLLAEAGWRDSDGDGVLDKGIDGARVPLAFEIISNAGNPIRKSVGLTVIDQMKRVGIDASFREIDWSIMLDKVKSYDYDAVILGWAMSLAPPDAYQLWHSSQAVQDGSNHVFFKNPEVDRLLEVYRTEFDFAKRKRLYDRFQEIIYDEQPYTFLFMQTAITARDRRFRGVTWYPSGGTDVGEWWVPVLSQRYAS